MKKRKVAKGMFVTFAIAISLWAATGCGLVESGDKAAVLQLSIRQENMFATKAGRYPMPDTNQFILQIKNSSGEYVYNGSYGSKPDQISVPAGNYSLSLVSQQLSAPAWETPVYGDNIDIVAASGETVSVHFLCKMVNSGVKVRMTERYVARYPGNLTISQEAGYLNYTSSETRFGFFERHLQRRGKRREQARVVQQAVHRRADAHADA